MSILSDIQIKELCVPPPFMVLRRRVLPSTTTCQYRDEEHFSNESKETLDKQTLAHSQQFGIISGVISYRETTPEEKAAFRPMVSPYEPKQVRTRPRPLTDAEYRAVASNHPMHAKDFPDGPLPMPDGVRIDENGITIDGQVEKIISWGQSSFGYDVRLANEFKIFTNINSTVIDPLNYDAQCHIDHVGEYCIIPPNSYILGRTLEYFKIPRDIMVICLGKSTYARVGAIVNVTPIEAGFEGHVVIEISNSTPLPLKVYANMGISQFVFFKGDHSCEISYADRGGKYQGQTGVQTAIV